MYHDLSPLSSMIFNLILCITARSETKFVLVSVSIWLYTWNKYRQIFVYSRTIRRPFHTLYHWKFYVYMTLWEGVELNHDYQANDSANLLPPICVP
nr:MAG TPA: hypothetical protein [Caudoviricetes sp.]